MTAILEEHGRTEERIGSPKMIIKLAFQCGMINDEKIWLDILSTRNILAHTYNSDDILELIKQIKLEFVPIFKELREDLSANWLS